jgi:hypothetical protein
MNVDDYLDFENPADDSADVVYRVFRKDARTPKIIEALQARGLTDHEIVIVFRLVSRIPSEWEIEKEARQTKEKRREELANRLRAILPHIEKDPDLSRLHFGTSTISIGAKEPDEGLISLPDCIREGISVLETAAAVDARFANADRAHEREIPLKRYAIRSVFALIEIEGKRAPNQLTAEIVSILIDAPVTANDVTQARKDVRRTYYREKSES